MKLFKVLTGEQLTRLNQYIDTLEPVDGTATTRGPIANLKKNLQITNDQEGFPPIMEFVKLAMYDSQVKAYTFLNKILSPRVAIYREEGKYDWHVDSAIMDLERADLSFTIFLNGREEYEGGEMEITLESGMAAKIKGNAGEIVVYSSGLLHRVKPVTKGERRVIVGWIRSNVKVPEYRERLYALNVENTRLREKFGYEESEKINQLYHQFLRDYSG